MWNLDEWSNFFNFCIPKAFVWGNGDKDKREYVRAIANNNFPGHVPLNVYWEFRIFVEKAGNIDFDIDNVPKVIVDAFCQWQIQKDDSQYQRIALFEKDTIDFVRVIEVGGERGANNMTKVEIFYRERQRNSLRFHQQGVI